MKKNQMKHKSTKRETTENAKPRRGDICITISKRSAAYGSRGASVNDRAKLTTNVIASAAKQSSNKKYIIANILDCFVAALLAMTCHLLPLRDFSRLRFPHFQFSIFNFQLISAFAISCFFIATGSLSAQSVSNIKASFSREKTEVTVSCYFESVTPYDLKLSYSIDNGRTWKSCISVSGDIKNQTTGTKNIVWKPVLDGVIIGELLFRVTSSIDIANKIEMVFVSGGTFTMGCTSEQGSDCYDNENPAHQVTLSDYYIGKYEVTQAQWEAVMGTGINQQRDKADKNWSLYGEGDDYPMYYISWNEVQEFIRKLNLMTGESYRLPTEAEWEYAARGGNKSQGYKYSGSANAGEVAWYDNNSGSKTHPVGQKSANELGIYDMSGNVREWCQDWYGAYSSGSQTNPVGASSGSGRVYRGGAWGNYARNVRVSNRGSHTPDFRDSFLGFRLARSSKEVMNGKLKIYNR